MKTLLRYTIGILALVLFHAVTYSAYAQESTSTIPPDEIQKIVDYHNTVRKEVGAPPVEWSPELAAFAQEWADNIAATGCQMQHRPRSGKWTQKYGENVFWGSGKIYTLMDAGKAWYSEKKFWRGGVLKANTWSKTGHYTQMVWAKTTKIGIGKAVCKNGATIIVGNYDPVGNMMGEKPY